MYERSRLSSWGHAASPVRQRSARCSHQAKGKKEWARLRRWAVKPDTGKVLVRKSDPLDLRQQPLKPLKPFIVFVKHPFNLSRIGSGIVKCRLDLLRAQDQVSSG